MKLSVVIVSYNVRHFLEQCLRSVVAASSGTECEIIVVDNDSVDGSCSMVMSQFPGIRLIRNSENRGFAAACNQAIRISSGEFILLLNPDTVVEEDTFTRCISFMKDHPEAGALGVKMINGNGKYLPESKRAFPTPATAFFKMTGIARLFPGSPVFNRYYMGHLSNSETAEIEIISGAFMFIRKKALDTTGLLDESYFMYGEDIDLSYRLIKNGFRNFYFPDVTIIHYKGASTRKSDVNYIMQFYKAMLIFTDRHFGKKGNRLLSWLLQAAIYFQGSASLIKTLAKKYFLPITDALVTIIVFLILIPVWEKIRFGTDYSYPPLFRNILAPSATLLNIISVALSGGYRIPSRMTDVLKGLVAGAVALLVVYSLLPQELRYSRAVVVIGSGFSMTTILLVRMLLSITGMNFIVNPLARSRRTVIISGMEGYSDLRNLAVGSDPKTKVAGRVGILPDDLEADVLGHLGQIREIIRVNRIDEVIFSARDLTASQIIDSMHLLSSAGVTMRLAPSGEKLLIGSSSVQIRGD